jgi:hypothetical protein
MLFAGPKLLGAWAASSGCALPAEVKAALLATLAASATPTPLFLRIIFQHYVIMQDPSPTRSGYSTAAAANDLYQLIESKLGQVFVSRVIGWLAAAKHGMTLPEMEVLVTYGEVDEGSREKSLGKLRQLVDWLGFCLQARPDAMLKHADQTHLLIQRICQFHLANVAQRRYLGRVSAKRSRHADLIRLFSSPDMVASAHESSDEATIDTSTPPVHTVHTPLLWRRNLGGKPDYRVLVELPYHLLCANRVAQLQDFTCRLEVVLAMAEAGLLVHYTDILDAALCMSQMVCASTRRQPDDTAPSDEPPLMRCTFGTACRRFRVSIRCCHAPHAAHSCHLFRVTSFITGSAAVLSFRPRQRG